MVHPLVVAIRHRPSMVSADGTDDDKLQTVALHLFGRAVEAVEYQLLVQGGLVGRVCYRQFLVRHGEADFSLRAVVADGVYHEVVNEAFQQGAVGADGQGAVREVFVEKDVAHDALQERGQLVKDARQADVLRLPVPAVVYPGEQEQVAVQPSKAAGILVESLYQFRLPPSKVGLLKQEVELAIEDGERGLELVRGVFGELLLSAVAGKAVSHQGFERTVEPGEFLDIGVGQLGQLAVFQPEAFYLPQGQVERLPQAAGDEAQGQHNRHRQYSDNQPELEHHALHDVPLQVECGDGLPSLHRLDYVYHIFGIIMFGKEVEQRRDKCEQCRYAGDELREHFA